jgi:hypothetical protein
LKTVAEAVQAELAEEFSLIRANLRRGYGERGGCGDLGTNLADNGVILLDDCAVKVEEDSARAKLPGLVGG